MAARRLFGNVAKSWLLGDPKVRAAALIDSPQILSSSSPSLLRRGAIYLMTSPLSVPAGDSGAVHHVHSEEAWNNKLGLKDHKLAVVDFTAAWCGPCRMVAPAFKELSKKYPQVLFLKVDVDELQKVASDWKVNAMPTFVFISEKNELHRVVGADTKELEAKIVELSK